LFTQGVIEMSNKKYALFVVGINNEGYDVFASCSPAEVEAEENRPVFFRRMVLGKYYDSVQSYKLEARKIISNAGWTLPILGMQKNYIAIPLVELGLKLKYEEQLYWKSFNIAPPDTIDEKWKQPLADEYFKDEFVQFNLAWNKKFEWLFFKPLENGDEHYFTSFRIPLSEDQSEFDHQILSLVKFFIDSMNEKKISEVVVGTEKGTRGITLLKEFLEQNLFPNVLRYIHFLRAIYWLRSSGVGHLKGDSYEEAKRNLNMEKQSRTDTFIMILEQLTLFIQALKKHFINDK
jgi:hypothetical protein